MSAASAELETVRRSKPAPIRPDWVSKTLAGLLLGLSLALICSGMLAALLTGMPLSVSGQLVMWLVPPIWLGVWSGVYFFAGGWHAWVWLGGANLLAFCIWWLLRPGSLA